jgi:hypothetical protein
VPRLASTTAAEKLACARLRSGRPDLISLAHCVRVDRDVHRAGGGAEPEQEEVELGRRISKRRQDPGEAEQTDGQRRQPRPEPVDQHAGRAHRDECAETDEHERQAELAVIGVRLPLNGGQRRPPGAPEDPESGESDERSHQGSSIAVSPERDDLALPDLVASGVGAATFQELAPVRLSVPELEIALIGPVLVARVDELREATTLMHRAPPSPGRRTAAFSKPEMEPNGVCDACPNTNSGALPDAST